MWSTDDTELPVRRFQETLTEEGCWPELYGLDILDPKCSNQNFDPNPQHASIAQVDRPRSNEELFGLLKFSCLREMHFWISKGAGD